MPKRKNLMVRETEDHEFHGRRKDPCQHKKFPHLISMRTRISYSCSHMDDLHWDSTNYLIKVQIKKKNFEKNRGIFSIKYLLALIYVYHMLKSTDYKYQLLNAHIRRTYYANQYIAKQLIYIRNY